MNKIKLALIGNDYEEVQNGAKYPKWDFKESGKSELEAIIMDKKRITSQNGEVTLVTFINKNTKEPGVFFCGTVLEDKLKQVPVHSCIKIVYEGKHPQKKYYQFKVFTNKAFRFSPDEYSLDDYQDIEQNQQSQNTQSPIAQNSKPAAMQIEEDLPF